MRLVEKWEQRMRGKRCKFVLIETVRAIFDRVAITADMPSLLTVQFPKGNAKQGYQIHQENIPWKEVISIRHYKD